jgi:hypothetical protein
MKIHLALRENEISEPIYLAKTPLENAVCHGLNDQYHLLTQTEGCNRKNILANIQFSISILPKNKLNLNEFNIYI